MKIGFLIRPPSRLEDSNYDNDASNHWESDQSKPKRKKLFLQHSTPPPVVPEMPNTQERRYTLFSILLLL
ncbi:uncharacterized protein LOC143449650 [Clavelina lepadiformis]|uniref:uncharacterized protein LOC143449650 n=1 Tax=Clavelina lepadiformis TaxID=159417 RepID=UPI00404342DF